MRSEVLWPAALIAALLLAGCSSAPPTTDIASEPGGATSAPAEDSTEAPASGWQDPTWCTDDTWERVAAAERVPLEEVLEITGLPELPLTGGCAFRNDDIRHDTIYVLWTQPFVATDPTKKVTGFQSATGLTSDWLKERGWEYCKTTDTLPPLSEDTYIGFGCWSSQSPIGNPDIVTTTYFGHGYEVEGQEAVDSGGATIGFGGSPYVSQGKFYLFDKEPQLLDTESEFFAWSVFR